MVDLSIVFCGENQLDLLQVNQGELIELRVWSKGWRMGCFFQDVVIVVILNHKKTVGRLHIIYIYIILDCIWAHFAPQELRLLNGCQYGFGTTTAPIAGWFTPWNPTEKMEDNWGLHDLKHPGQVDVLTPLLRRGSVIGKAEGNGEWKNPLNVKSCYIYILYINIYQIAILYICTHA